VVVVAAGDGGGVVHAAAAVGAPAVVVTGAGPGASLPEPTVTPTAPQDSGERAKRDAGPARADEEPPPAPKRAPKATAKPAPTPAPEAPAAPPADTQTPPEGRAAATVVIGTSITATARQLMLDQVQRQPNLTQAAVMLRAVAAAHDDLTRRFGGAPAPTSSLFEGAAGGRRRLPRGADTAWVPVTLRLTTRDRDTLKRLATEAGAPSLSRYLDAALLALEPRAAAKPPGNVR